VNEPKLSRRDFLKLTRSVLLAASCLLGLGGLIRFLSYVSQPAPQTEFDLGAASDYAPGSRTLLTKVPAILIRTGDKFSAISLVCTHLGCTVKPTTEGFTCPCHGSRYDTRGKVVRGPASNPLATLRVEQTADGKLKLFTD
jgi:cytochrome b6-f complex iron-sulfur subunit